MSALRRIREAARGTDAESAVDRAERYRAEARERGLVPDDWDGEAPLKRCQLCKAYNRPAFNVCRICAEWLPRRTVVPEDPRGAPTRGSGH